MIRDIRHCDCCGIMRWIDELAWIGDRWTCIRNIVLEWERKP